VLAGPFLRPRWRQTKRILVYYLASALGVAGIYAIRGIDGATNAWATYGLDYSTHTAFAVATGLSLFLWRASLRWAVVIVLSGYIALMVFLGYHGIADIATSFVAAFAVSIPWHVIALSMVPRDPNAEERPAG
jgi:hypothetical protein